MIKTGTCIYKVLRGHIPWICKQCNTLECTADYKSLNSQKLKSKIILSKYMRTYNQRSFGNVTLQVKPKTPPDWLLRISWVNFDKYHHKKIPMMIRMPNIHRTLILLYPTRLGILPFYQKPLIVPLIGLQNPIFR